MSKPTAAAVHYYSSKGNKITAGITAPFSDAGEQLGTPAAWYVHNLTKAHAESLTTPKAIEELVWLVEKNVSAGSAQLLDVYLSLVINGETFNLFVKEVTLNEWTIVGGGTALEAIGKTTVEPTVPSSTKELSCEGTKTVKGTFTVTEAVKNALERTIALGRSTEGTVGEGITVGEEVAIQGEAETATPIKYLEIHSSTVAPTCTSLVLGVYADNAGVPGTLLGEATCSGAALVTNGWCVATLASTITPTKGTKYWLAYLPVGGTFSVLLTTGTGVEYTLGEAGTTLKPFSGSWTKHEFTQALRASGIEGEGGGAAIILLAASAAASATSTVLAAPTQTPLVASASGSTASCAATATTQVSAVAAASSSAAELAVKATVQPVLTAASGSSSATAGISAATAILTTAALSASTAELAVTTATQPVLTAASGSSAAAVALRVPVVVPSAPANAVSAAELTMTAPALAGLAPAGSSSSSTTSITAPATLQVVAVSSSTSGATLVTPATLVAASGTGASASSLTITTPGSAPINLAAATSTTTTGLAVSAAARAQLSPGLANSGSTLLVGAPPVLALQSSGSSAAALTVLAVHFVPGRLTLTAASTPTLTLEPESTLVITLAAASVPTLALADRST